MNIKIDQKKYDHWITLGEEYGVLKYHNLKVQKNYIETYLALERAYNSDEVQNALKKSVGINDKNIK